MVRDRTFTYKEYNLLCITCCRIMNDKGQRVMTAYLIHSLPLLMSAVQIFSGDQMAVVGHLVGLEQLGYEKDIGMTEAVSLHYHQSKPFWHICSMHHLKDQSCVIHFLTFPIFQNEHLFGPTYFSICRKQCKIMNMNKK